ncbi:MAG: DUF4388 domain-containing protein [Candidatus Obscuribacterales bacterium]|nr:DUF4388 domain-containing protein [Candidatus Obscuribacterales bacterium]
MIQHGSSSAQKRLRLPECLHVPQTSDIELVFAEAAKQPGQLVELPWTYKEQQYVLSAKLERRHNEQSHQWSFYKGEGLHSKLEWSYETSDVVMIHDLVMTAFPEENQTRLQTESGQQRPVLEGSQRNSLGVMEGNLAQMPLPSLLASIASSQLTGRLSVQSHNPSETADLYFEEGALVDARRHNLEGEDAFLELSANSTVGDFRFFDKDLSNNRTIHSRLDSLLLKAATVADHSRYLDTHSLSMDSRLRRGDPNISEKQFEEKVAHLVPVEMHLQKRIYQMVDNKSTLSDLLEKCQLTRAAWTPVLFNLLSAGLVEVDNAGTVAVEKSDAPVEQIPAIDLSALDKFTQSMTRKETGVYTEVAFLYFLEHEYYRFHSYDTPFTLILFRIGSQRGMLTANSLKRTLDLVKGTVRIADILGHYDGEDFGLILPHTDPPAAGSMAARLRDLVNNDPQLISEIKLAVGIAGVPADCQDLILLMATARERKNSAVTQD